MLINSGSQSSFLDFALSSQSDIYSLIESALEIKKRSLKPSNSSFFSHKTAPTNSTKATAALLFFEPSTRTRFSFESACVRAGVHPLILSGSAGTSLEKDESIEDTILNLEAMRPLFFVLRVPEVFDFKSLVQMIKTPVINAGWGLTSHPTQALLDVMTLIENSVELSNDFNQLHNKKILFVGDIKHSRVVRSHVDLASKLNYQIGFCCPDEFRPSDLLNFPYFKNLNEALDWCDHLIILRVQKERHKEKSIELNFALKEYINHYRINYEKLKQLCSSGLVLHPGPINYGVEVDKDFLHDSRSCILKQVENGVFIRQALIEQIKNLKIKGVEND